MKRTLFGILVITALVTAIIIVRPRSSVAQGSGGGQPLISQASVTRSSDQLTHVVGSNEERLDLNPSESASVEVELSPGNGVVLVRAPEGGRINGQRELEIDTDQQGRNLELTFDPQDDTGLAYIEVSDSQRIEIAVHFWVGPRAALGQPGPNLTF